MPCLRAVAWPSLICLLTRPVCWERGLDSLDVRMQAHFDRARALAEYLAANEMVRNVRYPGLSSHPDHAVATGILETGFGPAVEFLILSSVVRASCSTLCRGVSHIARRRRNDAPFGSTRQAGEHRPPFAGTDDPLIVAATLDNALR